MGIKAKENLVGAWAFSGGVVLAVFIGIVKAILTDVNTMPAWMLAILILLGILIGFFNVPDRESNTFLIAGVSLVILSWMGMNAIPGITFLNFTIGKMLVATLSSLLMLFLPATVIVALKTLFASSRV